MPRLGSRENGADATGFEQTPDWPRMLDEAKGKETCAVGLLELRLQR